MAKSSLSSTNKKLKVYNIENGAYSTLLSYTGATDSNQVTYQYRADTTLAYCVAAAAGNVRRYSSGTNQQPANSACAGRSANGVQLITNYVPNPGLESGMIGGWTAGTISASIVKSGNQSIMFYGS